MHQRTCWGQDPMAMHCDDDAQTVAQDGVVDEVGSEWGLIQLRYSPSCNAYWGRYTAPAGTRQILGASMMQASAGRVTAWVPGMESIPTAGSNPGPGGSSWSGMVADIGRGVCTGVEVVLSDANGDPGHMPGAPSRETLPWYWGPCVGTDDAGPNGLSTPGGGGGGNGW
ncbi:DUF2690 domain-containing protein [Rhodococcoides fascians]|uniref:DUF2690 domain-containing protein n=1 Tax=Rhodococcoides fascians TaxID=1828 RepID=UPI0037BD6974